MNIFLFYNSAPYSPLPSSWQPLFPGENAVDQLVEIIKVYSLNLMVLWKHANQLFIYNKLYK